MKLTITIIHPLCITRPLEVSLVTGNVLTHSLLTDRPDVVEALEASIRQVLETKLIKEPLHGAQR